VRSLRKIPLYELLPILRFTAAPKSRTSSTRSKAATQKKAIDAPPMMANSIAARIATPWSGHDSIN
jgi:hypothetical protein